MTQKSVSTFEVSDTVSQLPPVNENFPDPIRSRISSGVSFGPLANGVYLAGVKAEIGENKQSDYKMHFISFHRFYCILVQIFAATKNFPIVKHTINKF